MQTSILILLVLPFLALAQTQSQSKTRTQMQSQTPFHNQTQIPIQTQTQTQIQTESFSHCNYNRYCGATHAGWKPVAASYLATLSVADSAASRVAIDILKFAPTSVLDAFVKETNGPAEYSRMQAQMSVVPNEDKEPMQSVVNQALKLQNDAPGVEIEYLSWKVAAGVVLGLVGLVVGL